MIVEPGWQATDLQCGGDAAGVAFVKRDRGGMGWPSVVVLDPHGCPSGDEL